MEERRSDKRWLNFTIAAAILMFAAKIAISLTTYGSIDAQTWEANLTALRADGAAALYRTGVTINEGGGVEYWQVFNHPPFMFHLLAGWGWLADVSGLPLRFWLRLSCAAADLASFCLLLGILRKGRIPFHPAVLLLVAASPVSLMISGFHGNTDPIMVALILLSLYLLQIGPCWLAGMALGMAVNIKIVPLLFLPAILLFLRGRKAVGFAAGLAAVCATGSLPLLAQDPTLIAAQVFGYSPVPGGWGLATIASTIGRSAGLAVYTYIGKPLMLAALAMASVWMNHRERRPRPLVQCGFLAFLTVAIIPGFGVQYLAWVVPWACLLSVREAILFHASAGTFLFLYYTRSSGGFPWYLANSVNQQRSLALLCANLACWGVICILCCRIWLREERAGFEEKIGHAIPSVFDPDDRLAAGEV
jgi:hypothetical protein